MDLSPLPYEDRLRVWKLILVGLRRQSIAQHHQWA